MTQRILALLVLLITACTPISFVRVDDGDALIGQRLLVRSDGGWNAIGGSGYRGVPTWTIDGLTIDSVRFFVDVKDGQPLSGAAGGAKDAAHVFRASMRPHEIVALFEAALSKDGSVFTLEKLEPVTFLEGKGFRFEFQVLRKDDSVLMRGLAYGAVRDGNLFAIAYSAPRLVFYDRNLPRAIRLFEGARLKS